MSQHSSFWARRKAAVAAEADAEAQAAVALEEARRAEALDSKDDAEVLEALGLPDPADMKEGDDFAAFLSRDVPERLRKRALRTLWRSNPVLANVDGLNDYDDDYRAAALLQEPVRTAYQVGKGMLAHVRDMERKAAEAAHADAAPGVVETPVVDGAAEPGQTALLETDTDNDADTAAEHRAEAAATGADAPEAEADSPAPRKMRFRFEEAMG